MLTVLFANELGLGRWHAELLGAISDALRALAPAVRVVFAVPDVVTASLVLCSPSRAGHLLPPPSTPTVLAAPHHMPAAAQRRQGATRSFADILADAGWAEPDTFSALVASWRAMLDLIAPEVIIADHAPTLMLAARTHRPRDIPVVQVGLGFSQPPTALPTFPSLLASSTEASRSDAGTLEAALLETLRRVLGTAPSALPAALTADASFVTCLEALDPYRDHRHAPALGIVEPVPGPLPLPPAPGPIVCYLSAEDPRSLPLLAALAASGHACRAYLRDASPALLDALRQDAPSHLELLARPMALDEALATTPLVVHHGGAGTIHQAIAAGRPQLLLPRYLEQAMNAQALVGRGVAALVPHPLSTSAVAASVDSLLGGRAAITALAWARLIEAEREPDAASTIARAALGLAAR